MSGRSGILNDTGWVSQKADFEIALRLWELDQGMPLESVPMEGKGGNKSGQKEKVSPGDCVTEFGFYT